MPLNTRVKVYLFVRGVVAIGALAASVSPGLFQFAAKTNAKRFQHDHFPRNVFWDFKFRLLNRIEQSLEAMYQRCEFLNVFDAYFWHDCNRERIFLAMQVDSGQSVRDCGDIESEKCTLHVSFVYAILL